MNEEKKKKCPTCNGTGEIEGKCECSSEWRGNEVAGEWQDCQCTPAITCPTCNGTGVIKSDS